MLIKKHKNTAIEISKITDKIYLGDFSGSANL
jgi:hypothetical protein